MVLCDVTMERKTRLFSMRRVESVSRNWRVTVQELINPCPENWWRIGIRHQSRFDYCTTRNPIHKIVANFLLVGLALKSSLNGDVFHNGNYSTGHRQTFSGIIKQEVSRKAEKSSLVTSHQLWKPSHRLPDMLDEWHRCWKPLFLRSWDEPLVHQWAAV